MSGIEPNRFLPTCIAAFLIHVINCDSISFRSSYNWAPVCSGYTAPRDTGVVRGEATRDAPVPVPGRPVRDGLQVISFRPICVRDGIILPRFLSSFRTTFLSYYSCILTFKFKCLNSTK